jgi:hypothetical protein
LLKNYLKQYFPNNGIIYRLLRPDERIKKRFIKQKYKRNEKLSRFTESCDCCFPLWIKIKHLNNIYSLKYWFDNEEYNKNEMLIPNLKFFERKNLMSNLGKVYKGINILEKTNNNNNNYRNSRLPNLSDEKMMKDKIKNSENEMRKKSLTLMAKKSKEDKDLQESLNPLSIKKSSIAYFEYSNSYNPMLSTNNNFGDDIAECVNLLSSDELQLPQNAQKVSKDENSRYYIDETINKKITKEEEDKGSSEEQQKSSTIVKNEIEQKKVMRNKEYNFKKLSFYFR